MRSTSRKDRTSKRAISCWPTTPPCLRRRWSKHNLELYREAENKEKLQLRYDTQYAKLEALIQAQDKEAGRYEPVKEGLLSVEGSNGKTKSTPLYYQMLEDNGTQEYYLTDEFIRTKILKHRTSAYVVLVEKAGNVNNGAVTCYGMYLVADDTAAPVKLKMLSDLPPYQDDYSTKNTEEIKEARKELDKIKELLDTSFTKEELKALIASTEKEVYSTQRAVRRAQIELDKKKKELGDGNVYAEFDGTVKAVRRPSTTASLWWRSPAAAVTTLPAPSASWIWVPSRSATRCRSAAG